MPIYKPGPQWSAPIPISHPCILAVNAGEVALVYNSEPENEDDGQRLRAGETRQFGGLASDRYVKIRATMSCRSTEVYIGPWWSR